MRRTIPGLLAVLWLAATGCGKKGPPLPPLVRVPAAPTSFSAVRQGSRVTLRFAVPSTNIDGRSPGDVARVEVFATSGLGTPTAEDVILRGTRIGSVLVNPPTDPDAPAEKVPPAGAAPKTGVDQGAEGVVTETLPANALADQLRSYVAVAFSPRGRRGVASNAVLVPMVLAPPAPAAPTLAYDATQITMTWERDARVSPLGVHVYDVTTADARLTTAAVTDGRFVDPRLEFGVERCYATRLVLTVGATSIESEPSPRACITPRDTFPPEAPTGLNAVPEAGAVSLIWNPVDAEDLAGYLVLRTMASEAAPRVLNETPIPDTTYRDLVVSGVQARYAIVAVDKAGNRSAPSTAIEETAR